MPVIYKSKKTGKRIGTGKHKGHWNNRRNRKRQVRKNTKAIALLNETQFRNCSYVENETHGPGQVNMPGTGVLARAVRPLIVPNQWLPVFGSQPLLDADRFVGKVVHPDNFLLSGMNIKVNIRLDGFHIGNNQYPIHYHYMIFSIKKEFREQVKWRTSVAGIPKGPSNVMLQYMQKGIDYEDFDIGIPVPNIHAQWRLNKQIYTVHASRKGSIGVWPAPLPLVTPNAPESNYVFPTTTSMKDCNRDFNINVKWKRSLKYSGFSQGSSEQSAYRNSWKTMNVEQVADSDQLYRVLFHNPVHVEASPLVLSESIEFFGKEPQ